MNTGPSGDPGPAGLAVIGYVSLVILVNGLFLVARLAWMAVRSTCARGYR